MNQYWDNPKTLPAYLLGFLDRRFVYTNIGKWVKHIKLSMPQELKELIVSHRAWGTHIVGEVDENTTITWGLLTHLLRRWRKASALYQKVKTHEPALDGGAGGGGGAFTKQFCCLGMLPLINELPAFNIVTQEFIDANNILPYSGDFKAQMRIKKRRLCESRSYDCTCRYNNRVLYLHPVGMLEINLAVWIAHLSGIIISYLGSFYHRAEIQNCLTTRAFPPELVDRFMFASYVLSRREAVLGRIPYRITDTHGSGYAGWNLDGLYNNLSGSNRVDLSQIIGLVKTHSLAWIANSLPIIEVDTVDMAIRRYEQYIMGACYG